MKAISLWNPWAALIRCGAKTIETRSWSTQYRGQLAIHAAKKRLRREDVEWMPRQFWEAFMTAMGKTGGSPSEVLTALPYGSIVAIATLVECVPVELAQYIAPQERLFGDFRPGRFAWILKDINTLTTPIPFRGMQGLFEVPALPMFRQFAVRKGVTR